MAKHNDTGKWGEDIAADYLTSHGYAIAERNWHEHHLEVDIIAYKGNRIVFVEVKTRSDNEDDPIEAVDRKKMMHLVRAAQSFVNLRNIDHEIQFDIIGISGTKDKYKIEHVADAFQPPLRTY